MFASLTYRAIADMLSQYRGNRSRPSLEGSMQAEADTPAPTVLPSSTELFYLYGQTLEQCGKYTTGEPMKKLSKVFAKWLKVFSDDVLQASLKKCALSPLPEGFSPTDLQRLFTEISRG